MSLEPKIVEGIKKATLAQDRERLETLRSIKAAIIEFNKSGVGREMNEEDEIKIINNQVKRRKDAIEMYEIGNRHDLANKERFEMAVIEEFLPQMLSENEIKEIIQKIIIGTESSEMKDFGKVMGAAMKEFKGRADGAIVQKTVKDILGGNS